MKDTDSLKLVGDPSSHTSLIKLDAGASKPSPIPSTTPSRPPSKQTQQQRSIRSLQQSYQTVSAERKWMFAFLISILALLLFSTFTVGILDRFCFRRGIDLFNPDQRQNELILTFLQFFFLLLFVRLLFQYL